MSTLQVDRITPYLSASVTIDGDVIQANAATTGSNTFVGDQNIQGTITASIQEGFALVGGVGDVSTLVATSSFGGALPSGVVSGSSQLTASYDERYALSGSGGGALPSGVVSGSAQITELGFATTGSNTFTGQQDFQGAISASVIEIGPEFGDGINLYQGGFSQIRFYSGSNQTEVGTWVNMQVNPSNGALAISSFPANNHFIDFDVEQTASIFDAPIKGFGGNLRIGSNTTITGSLTISGSSSTDLTIQGRQLISGPTTGEVPFLLVSSSDANTTYGRFAVICQRSGSLYPQYTLNSQTPNSTLVLTSDTAFTSSIGISVRDNVNPPTQFTGLRVDTDNGNGTQFKDIDSSTLTTNTFMRIAPNPGTNPPVEFKRSAEVTGSVSISDVLQLAGLDPLPAGAVGQLAVSASNLYYNDGATWTQIN